jgi:hypothetical protein
MARNNSRGRGNNNNNASGRNQYSDWGMMDMARERPFAAAAAAAGAAAAGLFLWSRRAQISNQLSGLSEQLGQWTESMGVGGQADDTAGLTTTGQSGSSGQRGMSEMGGANASLGGAAGGGGSPASSGGRGRAKTQPIG